ncbi:MAG TPA: hypothetical protein VGN72_12295 [Tepidisphaeraceae bacterium]|jgi:hypothetical protein|nr:hypothetical protein [Tepidisphaeraceae bacterium]
MPPVSPLPEADVVAPVVERTRNAEQSTANLASTVATCMEQHEPRRLLMLEREATPFRDFDAQPIARGSDVYGTSAIAHLALGRENEQANKTLQWVANWFEHPHPWGLDPQGEPDFAAIKLCTAYHHFAPKGLLTERTLQEVEHFFLNEDFRSKYHSENHHLMFRTARYLMAHAYRGASFQRFDLTSEQVLAEDAEWLRRFLHYRAVAGWGEFDSSAYLQTDLEMLCCLHDFAPDPALRKAAGMMIEWLLADMVVDSIDGMLGGAQGRAYEGYVLDHAVTHLYGVQHLYFGLGDPSRTRAAVELLLSSYRPHPLVVSIALGRDAPYENRERKHLHNLTDVMPAKPIEGSIRKYSYYTARYVLGCVQHQDPYPADQPKAAVYAHHQQHEWDLTIAGRTDARLFTHHPGVTGMHNYWTGDFGCRCGKRLQNKSAIIGIYDIPVGQKYQFIHAYVPRVAFDEVIEENGIIFVRMKQVCAALRLSSPYRWVSEGKYAGKEVISAGGRHGFACEVGLMDDFGGFAKFRDKIAENTFDFDVTSLRMEYKSSSAGRLYIDGNGRRELNGGPIDLNYPSNDCPYLHSVWQAPHVELSLNDERRVLDFAFLDPR